MNKFDETGARAAQKAETAQAVLAAARDEFEARGFDDASIRAIAARAGVATGTVLHHFGDKAALLHAALFDDIETATSSTLASIRGGSLHSRLHRLAAGVFSAYAARPALSRTMLRQSMLAPGDAGARFTRQVAALNDAIVAFVDDAIAAGEVRGDVDRALVGAAFFSFFFFGLTAWVKEAPLPHGPLGLVDHLLQVHLEGLRPAPTTMTTMTTTTVTTPTKTQNKPNKARKS